MLSILTAQNYLMLIINIKTPSLCLDSVIVNKLPHNWKYG